jgi:hypothetical protein
MLLMCLIDMLTKFKNYIIYVHNFGNFDFYFINKLFKENKDIKCKPFFKDNNLYSLKITINIKNKNHSITFKDSYLLLDHSLRKLGNDFKVDVLKEYFPYSFVNENNLNYVGEIPNYNYYTTNINKKDQLKYEDYINLTKTFIKQDWCIKTETFKYLKFDLLSLHKIINKFSSQIFLLDKINITKILSISALTMKMFRTNYLDINKHKIPIVKGFHDKNIRDAFYGGHVDVYIK